MAEIFNEDFFKLTNGKAAKLKIFVGPWKYVEEFHEVYELIYGKGTSIETCRKALSILGVWIARRSYLCPADVLATHVLLDILIKDVSYNINSTHKSLLNDLQSLYAHAVVRFFNFMSSTVQEHKMRTMYETARLLKMNSVVVDIRHLCSHGQILPELDMLRYVTKYCLRWIKTHYWQPLSENMQNVAAEHLQTPAQRGLEHKLNLLFSIYDTVLLVLVKGAVDMTTARTYAKGQRFLLLKQYYAARNCQRLRDVPNCIVTDLSELYRQACLLDLKDCATTLYVDNLLQLENFYQLLAIHNMGAAYASIFDSTQCLFRMLTINGLMERYFYALIKLCETNAHCASDKLTGASRWACELIKAFTAYHHWREVVAEENPESLHSPHLKFSHQDFTNAPKRVRSLLESLGYNTRYVIVIGYADVKYWDFQVMEQFLEQRLEQINNYTANIIKELLPLTFPPLSDEQKTNLLELINLRQQKISNINNGNIKPNEIVHTVNELERLFLKEQIAAQEALNANKKTDVAKQVDRNIWTIATENDVIHWSTTPLGKTPWELY